MPKDDVIEYEGKVVEALPNANFKVELPKEFPKNGELYFFIPADQYARRSRECRS